MDELDYQLNFKENKSEVKSEDKFDCQEDLKLAG